MRSPYPPDEFDRVERPIGRRGAHRARPRLLVGVVPVLFVAVAVLAVVIATTTLLSSRPPQSAATGGGGSPIGSGETTGSATAPPSETLTSPPPEPTDTGTTSPGPEIDRDAPVRVVNGTSTAGLARRGADLLLDAGWDVSGTGNYRGEAIPTTVFYGTAELLDTAEAVADELGGAEVELDPDFTESITVVLGADFEGADFDGADVDGA